jgi:phage-related protein
MPETMKAQAITTAIIAFQEYNSYEKISANISAVFDQLHGEYWQCVIGPHGFNSRFNYIAGTYLSFAFGEAQVVLFQIMKQVRNLFIKTYSN